MRGITHGRRPGDTRPRRRGRTRDRTTVTVAAVFLRRSAVRRRDNNSSGGDDRFRLAVRSQSLRLNCSADDDDGGGSDEAYNTRFSVLSLGYATTTTEFSLSFTYDRVAHLRHRAPRSIDRCRRRRRRWRWRYRRRSLALNGTRRNLRRAQAYNTVLLQRTGVVARATVGGRCYGAVATPTIYIYIILYRILCLSVWNARARVSVNVYTSVCVCVC